MRSDVRKLFDDACASTGFSATEEVVAERNAAFSALETAVAAPAMGVVEILMLVQTLLKVIPNIQTVITMLLEIFKQPTA